MTLWEISEEYPAISDHELLLLRWEDIDVGLFQPNTSRATSWDIQGLIDDKNQLQKAQQRWKTQSQDQLILHSLRVLSS